MLGYALPGAVLAVGILLPLGKFDNAIAFWMQEQFGVKTGLLLTGTIAALIYAYVVRFLAVAFHTVEAGLTRVTPSMDDAARSLGLSPGRTLARVHVPILWGSLATAALLVFVDVMKELPATFAMRPFNFDTLAVEAYNLAKDERIAEAAVPSLVMVGIALLPLILLSRQISRSPTSSSSLGALQALAILGQLEPAVQGFSYPQDSDSRCEALNRDEDTVPTTDEGCCPTTDLTNFYHLHIRRS